jgi:hypothetical protein
MCQGIMNSPVHKISLVSILPYFVLCPQELLTTCKILSNVLLSRLPPNADKIIGDQLIIIYSAFHKYLRENGDKMRQCISYL